MRYALWLVSFAIVYASFVAFGVWGIVFILTFLFGHELGFKWGRGRWRTIFD